MRANENRANENRANKAQVNKNRANKVMVVVLGALAFGWGLGAADNGVKIGIVDLDQAVVSTDQGKVARDELERKKRDGEFELKPMIEEYQGLADEYQKKRVVLAPEKLREMELDITELQSRIELKQKEVQNRLRVDLERLLGPIRQKMVQVVEKIGRDEGFSLILMRATPGIMYSREALDITDQVIEDFNKAKDKKEG